MPVLHLMGLDIGSTTTSAIIARAQVLRNSVTHRMELARAESLFRSEMALTPFKEDLLDESAILQLLETWVTQSQVPKQAITAGGALVTGLAARAHNAKLVTELVEKSFPESFVAIAEDPLLESWLAFKGNCDPLCRTHPRQWYVNFDIGGGTTNWALGCRDEVRALGWLYLGARHVQFVPHTYNLTRLSSYGERLFAHLGIEKGPGDTLSAGEKDRIVQFYVRTLEALLTADTAFLALSAKAYGLRALPAVPALPTALQVTFSGGVGSLYYSPSETGPGGTPFGDLGLDLALALRKSPLFQARRACAVPPSLGRATVQGMALHQIEVSGTSLHLPQKPALPLRGIPILGTLPAAPADLNEPLRLAQLSAQGGCFYIDLPQAEASAVKALGQRLYQALEKTRFPKDRPLVLLVSKNCGKVLGAYGTNWGQWQGSLYVIDEIPPRDAHFVHIGRPIHQIVPVSFYGMS